MANLPASDDNLLPLDVEEKVDEICDRFEGAWKQGRRPRIEDYLPALEEPGRSALLRELIKVDIVYRRRGSENPTAEEYQDRFPTLASSVAISTGTDALTLPVGPPAQRPEPFDAQPTGRYLLGEEIGSGGMGVVLRAQDTRFHRTLAVKVLLGEHRGSPELVRRFLEEAEVMGQLQHPGIPPVHDLGELPDGRPFFAMKLIKGRTLAELLRERPSPEHDLPRFLGIFQQLCQTIGYAHSRGILHRDLKPSNVMVGAFGEVQVMDWGLAKVLPQGTESPESPAGQTASPPTRVRTARGNAADAQSQVGSVIGTPAYMPPEQANGLVDLLDSRSDVFGLGAVLCETLTGQPPYVAASSLEVLLLAAAAKLADARLRLDRCGADGELVVLATRCLAPDQSARPGDAGVVADLVAAYQAQVRERLRQVELEKAQAQLRAREERRRRRLTVALAAAVLGLVLVGGGGWLWVEHDRQARRDDTIQAVNLALGKAEQLRQQADRTEVAGAAGEQALALWQQALAAVQQAEVALSAGEADPTTRERVATLRVEVEKRALRAERALGQACREVQLLIDLDEARLVRSQATSQGLVLNNAASAAAYERAFTAFGLEVLRLPEAEAVQGVRALRSELRTAVLLALDDWTFCVGDLKVRERLRQVAGSAAADSWRRGFRKAKDHPQLEALAAEALRLELPASSLFLLSVALNEQGATETAAVVLRRAVQLHPADFWIHYQLAGLLGGKGQQVLATVLEERVGHLRAAVAARPQSPSAHNNLGHALYDKKDLEGAIAEFRQALKLDTRHALAHTNLGSALYDKKDLEGALASFQRALKLNPEDASAHLGLGVVLEKKGDGDEAIKEYKEALRLKKDYPEAHFNLGFALRARGDLDGAIKEFQAALGYKKHIPEAHYELDITLRQKGDVDGAIVAYQEALHLKKDYPEAQVNLGALLCDDKEDYDAGIAAFREALRLKKHFPKAHFNLGVALFKKRDFDGAIKEFQAALRLKKDYPAAHLNLGSALVAKGDVAGAIAQYRHALKLDPKNALAHYNLGIALTQQARFAEALAAYHRAADLFSRSSPADAKMTEEAIRYCELLAALEKRRPALRAGKEQPTDNADRLALAHVCCLKKLNVWAARLYADAFAADPKVADDLESAHRYDAACSAALAAAGQGEDAGKLKNKERSRLRKQALDWLRADLGLWTKRVDKGQPQDLATAQKALRHWQKDTDLASLRDEKALPKLPEAEQQTCRRLWADVAALLERAATER
jgi:serine/threonine-protein kinase